VALTTTLAALIALQAPAAAPVVADLELVASTPVPSATRIKPYRSALVAQEYVVRKVVKGKDADVKPKAKIRVFRWGILETKPTSIAKAKKGDKVRLTLKRLSGWVEMEREYQVDELDSDLAITYYVEVGKPK
jgi:hypothetical protein